MSKEKHLEDLQEIRSIMERSSRFISLSGLSGVIAGIWAIAGSIITYVMIENFFQQTYENIFMSFDELVWKLLLIAICVFSGALGSAIFFTNRKAKKDNVKIWNKTSKKLLINLSIPFGTGTLLVLFLMYYQLYALIAPVSLIFYGLACVNASHNTYTDLNYLGISIVFVGLVNLLFLEYGLCFWAFGFGVLHILYGSIIYLKYEKQK